MSKFYKIDSKIFTTTGVIVFLVIIMSNTSIQSRVYAADPSGKPLFNCVYDSDKNKEVCCEGIDDNLKCLECDADLQTGQKYNCKEVPARSEDVQPTDLVKAPQDLDKLPQNLSESES